MKSAFRPRRAASTVLFLPKRAGSNPKHDRVVLHRDGRDLARDRGVDIVGAEDAECETRGRMPMMRTR